METSRAPPCASFVSRDVGRPFRGFFQHFTSGLSTDRLQHANAADRPQRFSEEPAFRDAQSLRLQRFEDQADALLALGAHLFPPRVRQGSRHTQAGLEQRPPGGLADAKLVVIQFRDPPADASLLVGDSRGSLRRSPRPPGLAGRAGTPCADRRLSFPACRGSPTLRPRSSVATPGSERAPSKASRSHLCRQWPGSVHPRRTPRR